MRQSVKEAIDSLLDLRDQCSSMLETRINNLLVSIEYQGKLDDVAKENIRWQANEVKDWMGSFHLWIDNAVDSLYNEYVGEHK